jgi:hypothetical protein
MKREDAIYALVQLALVVNELAAGNTPNAESLRWTSLEKPPTPGLTLPYIEGHAYYLNWLKGIGRITEAEERRQQLTVFCAARYGAKHPYCQI